MPTDRPKYHLVNDEDFKTFLEGLDYMKDRPLNAGAFERADDLERRAETGPLVDVKLYVGGEWSGLYVDGKLATYGDHYLAEDRLKAMIGVVEERGDDGNNVDWLKDGEREPFGTIEEVAARKAERLGGEAAAAAKREEARRLLEEAEALDGQKVSIG